jgi:predicted metal-binding membrane protein
MVAVAFVAWRVRIGWRFTARSSRRGRALSHGVPADLRAAGAIYGAEFLRSLCIVTPDAAGFAGLVAMWLVMSAAMMAPTALPAFATYDELGARSETRFGALVAGYLAVSGAGFRSWPPGRRWR